MDNQSIFDILNLNFFRWNQSRTYYTCQIESKKWVCIKGLEGEHVVGVPSSANPTAYLEAALAYKVELK